MGATEILERLEGLGVSIRLDGAELVLRPGSKVPHDLLDDLRREKPAIMQHLRYRQKYPGDGPPGDAELREIEDRVLSEGYCLLWSTVLEDLIAFHRDEDDKAKIPPGFVHYSLQELERLFGGAGVAVSTLRLIHQAKKLGGGTVISSEGQP